MRKKSIGSLLVQDYFKIDLVRLSKFHSAGKVFTVNQKENTEIMKFPMGMKFSLISFHFLSFHFIFLTPSNLIPSTDKNLWTEFLILGINQKIPYLSLSMAVIPKLQNTALTTITTSWARVLRQLLWRSQSRNEEQIKTRLRMQKSSLRSRLGILQAPEVLVQASVPDMFLSFYSNFK